MASQPYGTQSQHPPMLQSAMQQNSQLQQLMATEQLHQQQLIQQQLQLQQQQQQQQQYQQQQLQQHQQPSISSDGTGSSGMTTSAVAYGGQQAPFSCYSALEEEIRIENLRKRKEQEKPDEEKRMLSHDDDKDDETEDDEQDANHGPIKRLKKNQFQVETLEEAFKKNPLPSRKMKEKLALECSLSPRTVQVWFQNRRAKERRQTQKENGDELQDQWSNL